MQAIRRIVIIGTGNVATALGRTITAAGYTVVQVYGRNSTHAEQLASLLQATPVTDLRQLDLSADLYLIAVTDSAIPELTASLQLPRKLVVHTAGSVSKEVLGTVSDRYGILYPLQSLRREMEHLPIIPLLIDAAHPDDLAALQDFAQALSAQVQVAGDEQRLKLHVAAVIVSNFTNHLYALAEQYCVGEKADFSLLWPLIAEVATRLQYMSPQQAQTGPAIRNDQPTIEKHLALLEQHGHLQQLYRMMTESIQKSL